MASFSFRAGNARGLLRIPLYALAMAATAFVPRKRGSWIFGSAAGVADGALALWQVVGEADAHWATSDAAQDDAARRRGIRPVRKGTLRGWWRTARAETIVVTHGFGDVNRYGVSGAVIVQLWHGIPLKRLGLDSDETTQSAILPRSRVVRSLLRLLYRRAQRRIRILPVASHLVRGRIESAFGLSDAEVIVTGEPRVDVLSPSTPDTRGAARRALVAHAGVVPSDARLVLYAPTWRDGDDDPAVPTGAEWAEILALLDRRNAVLVVRSHPLGAGDYAPPGGSECVLALPSGAVPDITPFLPGFDALITDYSSLLYDVGLVPLPVVLFAPDLDAYARRRGLYGTYRDVAPEGWATTWTDVVARLDALLASDDAYRAAAEASASISATVHDFRDGHNSARVHRAIIELLHDRRTRGKHDGSIRR